MDESISHPIYKFTKLIAATTAPVTLKNNLVTVEIFFPDNSEIDSLIHQLEKDKSHSGNLFLHFEQLTGNDVLPPIDAYLNLEDVNKPKDQNYIGSLGLYGLPESSAGSVKNKGTGQHRVLNVGQVFSKVQRQPNWSQKFFRLTLIANSSVLKRINLHIGRIALYFQRL